jgi:maleylacetate reductase
MLVSGGPEAQYAVRVERQLGARIVARFTDVVMHVPVPVAQQAIALAAREEVDLIIALGGGSSTGMAKAVALETGLPILAIPTTYAGSEMTSIWGLTENNRKTTGRDPRVLPRTVIYDPELTVSLPVDISAASGMNALAHLVEGLYAPGLSPLSAMQAQEGVRALAASLPRVVADPLDLEARGDALYGAWLAGWTLGTTGMGVHHKICHVLGGAYNLPHAPMHSAVLPYATAFNTDAAPAAMDAITRALNDAGIPATNAASGIWDLARAIGAPTCLVDVGFDVESVEEAAAIIVAGQPVNPRAVDVDGVVALLRAACVGARPESTL